jgi:exoribonuclease R
LVFFLKKNYRSPIRRHADVVVHRLLTATLNPAVRAPAVGWVDRVAAQCNQQKVNARKAQEQSGRLFLALMLQVTPAVVPAVVLSFGTASATVGLLQYGHEARVFFGDVKGIGRYTLQHDGKVW